jgi:RimJ/RimL family protein N-acetyltransferase
MTKKGAAMKTLETDRLTLRKFSKNDFTAVHNYAGCAENVVYMIWGPNSEEQTSAFIDRAIALAEEIPCANYQYAAVTKNTGSLIGACNITVNGEEAEIGWILHRNYWKKGYGTEMGGELLRFGFEDLKLHRILAHCDAENVGSFKLMESIGMRREGLFVESRPARLVNSLKPSAMPDAADRKSPAAQNAVDRKSPAAHDAADRVLSSAQAASGGYFDELSYAILKGEWETHREIEYYNTLPCVFNGFVGLPDLTDGVIRLICTKKAEAKPEKKFVPCYEFYVCANNEKVGGVSLRVGYSEGLYYSGNIGYDIDEKHRGKGYAGRACRLLLHVAKAHGMQKLLITNNYTNNASKRVCEKLGARLLRVARLPEWHDIYKEEGGRLFNIFVWDVT